MEEINFEKWFLDNYQKYRFKPLKYILETITPYFDYLPNTKNCLLWLFNENDGSYSYRHDGERYFDFIIKVEDRIKDYSKFEKLVIVKILITFLEREYKGDVNDIKTLEKENREFSIYTLKEIEDFNNDVKLQEKTLLYFKLEFKKLNNNPPFFIIDILDKEEDFLKWTIEKNPNYKEITQTPPPDEVEPITLPENIKTTKVNTIRLLHYTGILEFLLKKYPRMNESNLASFFELITKTPITHKNQNTHFYKNNDNSMYHKDDLDLILSKFNMIAENPKK